MSLRKRKNSDELEKPSGAAKRARYAKSKSLSFIGGIKEAPEYLVDNEYIIRGYRIGFELEKKRVTLKSMFAWHNETINIWSHFIGSLIFLLMCLYTFYTIPCFQSLGQEMLLKYQERTGPFF